MQQFVGRLGMLDDFQNARPPTLVLGNLTVAAAQLFLRFFELFSVRRFAKCNDLLSRFVRIARLDIAQALYTIRMSIRH